MEKAIALIIIILFVSILLVILIITVTIKKQLNNWNNNKKFALEQETEVKLLKIEKLDVVTTYYGKIYTHKATFEGIYSKELLILVVEEFDAKDLLVFDEYRILHDGYVVFSYKLLN